MMKHFLLLVAAVMGGIFSAPVYGQSEEFSVATLNVDGLPAQVLFPINPDGPGEKYTPEIAEYLLRKNYDVVGVQENFNFYDVLFQQLNGSYQHDECAGKISLANLSIPYPFDGINLIWRNGIVGEHVGSESWEQGYGLTDHANDLLTMKGFRRYELTLKGGSRVVVYNGHWDASNGMDEESGEDMPDRLARMSQWRQLRDHLMSHLDDRPVIVMGDMNSYYCRDSIQHEFVDFIEATGRAKVFDAWVETERNGVYPALVEGPVTEDKGGRGFVRQGEMLDKILFVNPTGGSRLTALSYQVDSVSYFRSDAPDVPLGDHFPVSVVFRSDAEQETAVKSIDYRASDNTSPGDDAWYDLSGRCLTTRPSRKGLYIRRGRLLQQP